jgi:hypothetical protein
MVETSSRPRSTVEQIGGTHIVLTEEQIRTFVRDQLAAMSLDGRSLCVIVPDGTRSCPLPLLVSEIHSVLHGRVRVSPFSLHSAHMPR